MKVNSKGDFDANQKVPVPFEPKVRAFLPFFDSLQYFSQHISRVMAKLWKPWCPKYTRATARGRLVLKLSHVCYSQSVHYLPTTKVVNNGYITLVDSTIIRYGGVANSAPYTFKYAGPEKQGGPFKNGTMHLFCKQPVPTPKPTRRPRMCWVKRRH